MSHIIWKNLNLKLYGAEICELVGLYIQSELEKILPKLDFEFYWDDCPALLRNLNGQ